MHEILWQKSRYLNVTSTYQQLSFPKSFSGFDESQLAKPLVNLCLQTGLVAKHEFSRIALVTSSNVEEEDNFFSRSLPFNCPISNVKMEFTTIVEDILFHQKRTLYIISGKEEKIPAKSYRRLLEINRDLELLLPNFGKSEKKMLDRHIKQNFFTKAPSDQKIIVSLKNGKFQDFSLIPYTIEPQELRGIEKLLKHESLNPYDHNRFAWIQGAIMVETFAHDGQSFTKENIKAFSGGGLILEFLKIRSADYEINHDFFIELAHILNAALKPSHAESSSDIKWLKVHSPFSRLNYYLENFFSHELASSPLLNISDNLPHQFVNSSGFLFCLLEQKMRGGILINLEAFPEINVVIIK